MPQPRFRGQTIVLGGVPFAPQLEVRSGAPRQLPERRVITAKAADQQRVMELVGKQGERPRVLHRILRVHMDISEVDCGADESAAAGLRINQPMADSEWQIANETGDRLTSLIQDYDWADEVLHARIGRKWLVKDLGSQTKAMECGDKAWSHVLVDWAKWREDGLTQHRNWWPEVYRAACRHWGIEPDPKLLAYSATYEDTRADLKSL